LGLAFSWVLEVHWRMEVPLVSWISPAKLTSSMLMLYPEGLVLGYMLIGTVCFSVMVNALPFLVEILNL
jgi:hypothetical protein